MVTPLAPGNFWFDHDFVKAPSSSTSVSKSTPKGRKIDLQSPPQARPTIFLERRPHDIHLAARQPQAPADDEAKKQQPPAAEAKIPDVQLTTFATWARSASGTRISKRAAPNPRPKSAPRQELDSRPHDRSRKNPRALRLRRKKHPLRQPLLRPGPLPAAFRRGRLHKSIRRLQGQAHAARLHAPGRGNPLRRSPDSLHANSIRRFPRRPNSTT